MLLNISLNIWDNPDHPEAKESREGMVGVFKEYAALPDDKQVHLLGVLTSILNAPAFLERHAVQVDVKLTR